MIRVFVETPNGCDSAGFTVPESAAANCFDGATQSGLVAVRATPRP
jgi:hypothetical protein